MTAKNPDAPRNTLSIGTLKMWASRNFPRESKLRQVILSEKETLTCDEFISKLETWLLLAVNEEK